MATKAVIIVPSQGKHSSMFEGVAKSLSRKVYSSKAAVVRTTVTDSGGTLVVTFSKLDGKAFSWDDVSDLSTVITISHGGGCDGPNLAYTDGGYQPWGSNACDGVLSTGGSSFWKSIGNELKSGGKVILIGCYMGTGSYAQAVADTTRRMAYASDGLFAAANEATTLKHVKAIEKGLVIRPMKRFNPAAASP